MLCDLSKADLKLYQDPTTMPEVIQQMEISVLFFLYLF